MKLMYLHLASNDTPTHKLNNPTHLSMNENGKKSLYRREHIDTLC